MKIKSIIYSPFFIVALLALAMMCFVTIPLYKYEWKLKVTYANGDIDTIYADAIGNDRTIRLYITNNTGDPFFESGTEPYIALRTFNGKKPLAFNVRKYDVISFSKTKWKK